MRDLVGILEQIRDKGTIILFYKGQVNGESDGRLMNVDIQIASKIKWQITDRTASLTWAEIGNSTSLIFSVPY